MKNAKAFVLACLALLGSAALTFGQNFLDVTSFTPGAAASFAGTLSGIGVTGSLVETNTGGNGTYYVLDPVSNSSPPSYTGTSINGTSPQYSYSNIYSPFVADTDQIGYNQNGLATGTARITINFAQPITDPVFQVANLDSAAYDFSATAGLSSLVLLSGNGGSGDGLGINGNMIIDLNPNTLVAQNTNVPPLTSGARSAYGSVELVGTFSSLTFDVLQVTRGGDGGSFTIAAIPEPSAFATFTFGALVLGAMAAYRVIRRRTAARAS